MPPDTLSDPSSVSFGAVTPYYDHLMSGVPYRFWADYIERLWKKHGTLPSRVLDLACGTGTMSRLLDSRGYLVTGVDLSHGMLAVARSKVAETGQKIEFLEQDAVDLDLGELRFEAVICLFDSLNYLLDPEQVQAAFARCFLHLEPGGTILFDVNTEYALAEGMFNQSCTRRDEALHYRWRSRYDPLSRLCTVHMRFSYEPAPGQERQIFTEVHRQRAYSKDDLIAWLQGAGFAGVAVYDAYSADPPHKRSDRLFYIAVKPRE